MKDEFKPIKEASDKIIENIEKVIIGKKDKIELLLIAFLSRGHVLINDVPGVGKTMLARAFAVSISGAFKRVQCTPDLLPSDIIGVSIFNPESRQFRFRKGPLFSQILLVDEINRATPRTQSAFLEAMGENQITVEGQTMPSPDPFTLLATQNPVEFEGTFPLPEAQMDRFFFSFDMGYPEADEEMAIIESQQLGHPIDTIKPVTTLESIATFRDIIGKVYIENDLKSYIINMVANTRKDYRLSLGASPRGSLVLVRAAQAYAVLKGRDYVIPDDIKYLAPFALSHRLMVKAESRLKGYTGLKIINEILQSEEVPLEENE